MPAYEVRRITPVLAVTVVEAEDAPAALEQAARLFVRDAYYAAACAIVKRQPQRPDDTGDERSEVRYEYTDDDARDDEMREHRWGPGGAESPREGTQA